MTGIPNLTTHHLAQLSLLRGQHLLLFADIIFIEGQGNYTEFYCRCGKRILTSKSLSFYHDKLPTQLTRVHKSYFVNTQFIKAFEGEFVHLIDGRRIPVSRRRQRAVRNLIIFRTYTS